MILMNHRRVLLFAIIGVSLAIGIYLVDYMADPPYRFPGGRWETLRYHPPVPFAWDIEFDKNYSPQWIYFSTQRNGLTVNISIEADFFDNMSCDAETATFRETNGVLTGIDLYDRSGGMIGELYVVYYDFSGKHMRYITLSDGTMETSFFESDRIWNDN